MSAEKLTFEKKPKGLPLEKNFLPPNFFKIFWGVLGPPGPPPVIKFSPPFKFYEKSTFPESQLFRRHMHMDSEV